MKEIQQEGPKLDPLLEREKKKTKENHFIIEQLVALILDKTKKMTFEDKSKNIIIRPDKIEDFNLKKVEAKINNLKIKEVTLKSKIKEVDEKFLVIKKDENNILTLRKEILELNTELKQLRKDLESKQKKNEENEEHIKNLLAQITELNNNIDNLQTQRTILTKENIDLKADIVVRDNKIKELTAEILHLRENLASEEASDQEIIKYLKERISNKEDEVEKLKTKYDQLIADLKIVEKLKKEIEIFNINKMVICAINNLTYQTDILIYSSVNAVKTIVNADFIKNELAEDIRQFFQSKLFKFNKVIFNNEELTDEMLKKRGTIYSIIKYDYGDFKDQNAQFLIKVKVTDEAVLKVIDNLTITRKVSNLVEANYFSHLIDGNFIKNFLSDNIKEYFDPNSFKFINLLINNKIYNEPFARFLELTIKWVDAEILYSYKKIENQKILLKLNIFDIPWIIQNFLQPKQHAFHIQMAINSTEDQLYDKVQKFILSQIPQDILDSFPKNYIIENFSLLHILYKKRSDYHDSYSIVTEEIFKKEDFWSLEVVVKVGIRAYSFDPIYLFLDVR